MSGILDYGCWGCVFEVFVVKLGERDGEGWLLYLMFRV